LPRLVERLIVVGHERTAFEGTREFAFHHALLHRVAYDSVLKSDKRDYHGRVARWLDSRTRDRAGEFSALLAHHFERAGDSANAVLHLGAAAERAERRFETRLTIDYLTRALALTSDDDLQGRFELVFRRRVALSGAGRPSDEEADVLTLEALAGRLDEDTYRARAASARASFAVISGDFDGAAHAAEQVVMLADSVTPSTVSYARINWARAVQYRGDYAQAQAHVEEGLRLARQAGDRRVERVATCQLGLIDAELGRFSGARRHFEDALKSARDSGDKTMENILINNLASVELSIGHHDEARGLLEAGERLCRDAGSSLTRAYTLGNLAMVMGEQNDARNSLEVARETVDLARRFKTQDLEGRALLILGDAEVALGMIEEATASYRAALELFQQMGRPTMLPLPLSRMANAALKRKAPDRAMQHVAEVIAHVDAGLALDRSVAAGIYFTCFEVMAAVGHARADEFLRRAYDEIMEQAGHLEAAERRTFLAHVATHAAIVRAWQSRPRQTVA
jgi:tetratricopeptide (TPR) repeat protein